MPNFPTDWCWIVAGDETRVFSSKIASYLPADDPAYVSWGAAGDQPTRIINEAELADVLTGYALPLGPLPAPVPEQIGRAQAKLELLAQPSPTNAGKTCYDDVLAMIAGLTDPVLKARVEIYFNDEPTWHRAHPTLLQLAEAMTWSSDFVDTLFRNAPAQT